MKMIPTLPGLTLDVVTPKKPHRRKPLVPSGRTRKGARVEREIAGLHNDIGIRAARVRGSGNRTKWLGQDFAADVRIWAFGDDTPPLVAEVKARTAGGGFRTLERWLGAHDVLFLRRNGAAPIVVLPWQTWAKLIARGRP